MLTNSKITMLSLIIAALVMIPIIGVLTLIVFNAMLLLIIGVILYIIIVSFTIKMFNYDKD